MSSLLPAEAIIVLSRVETAHLLASARADSLRHVLSIGGAAEDPPDGLARVAHTRLVFEDLHSEERGGPRRADVAAVIDLARELRHPEHVAGTVLVHCLAGVSRSTAAAMIIIACWLGDHARSAEIYDHVRAIRACAVPNLHMLELADDLLGTGGAMAAAARDGHGAAVAALVALLRGEAGRGDA